MADGRREKLACGTTCGREGSHREKAPPHPGPGAPELACPHPGHCQLLLDYRLAWGRALAPADHEAARYELLRGRLGLNASLHLWRDCDGRLGAHVGSRDGSNILSSHVPL